MSRFERWLRRFGPVTAGLISALVIWFTWGELEPRPLNQDEMSYVLQAEIFATGRWTAPSPPLPEFFEQPHVQVVPALASKYPPGHALVLTLGALVGFTPLLPLLLTGATAALLFALVTRVTNPWVALVAWPTWLFAPGILRFQPGYMSELTSVPLVLASWWALLSWRETRRRRWLLTLALCIGWGAITRPLTMLAIAIPIGIVVIRDVVRGRHWKDFGLAFALGTALLGILPVWSAQTTGSWRVSPIQKYRLDYLPFDKIGFTPDSTPPRREYAMSKVLVETYDFFMAARTEQSVEALPLTILHRTLGNITGLFKGERLLLLVLALAGLFYATPPMRFALASSLLLFAAYVPYAHWAGWTIYYLETVPVAAAFTGLGTWHLAQRVSRARSPMACTLMAALIAVTGVPRAVEWRGYHRNNIFSAMNRELVKLLPKLPSPGILFVHYSSQMPSNPAIVRNSASLDAEPMWIVHDLGPRNTELSAAAPDRATHVLDVERFAASFR
ncbi:MAG: ArnT family glycosyltransferase [Gemmatimonadaceae bacterium]